jgi:hypothetical protein
MVISMLAPDVPGFRAWNLVLHSADVFVQPDGMMYMTDFNARLYIMEWIGE